MVSPERMRYVEKMIMLSVIDSNWKDYLYNMDQLREGINWRAYGQRDPRVEYQYEAFGMFKTLMETIDMEIVERIFRGYTGGDEKALKQVFKVEKEKFIHEEYTSLGAGVQPVDGDGPQPRIPAPSRAETDDTYKRNLPKVGRNDICPCGSGKKYKKCCGAA
jgi:preprotein translocase subunit SecA